MTQEQMNILVPKQLRKIEKEYNVTVLYAVESGSRAWGFASPDSDFDVRFIYCRKPADYLKLNPVRDVIEIPIDDTWDVSGWDLNKSLKLLYKSNPGLYDWMQSPIVYCNMDFKNRIEPLLRFYCSKSRLLHHYCGIAGRKIEAIRKLDKVSPKRYFYAIRAILACCWIEKYDYAPPVVFNNLVEKTLPHELRPILEYILEQKKSIPEKGTIKRIETIDSFLDTEFEKIGKKLLSLQKEDDKSWDLINSFFVDEIGRY